MKKRLRLASFCMIGLISGCSPPAIELEIKPVEDVRVIFLFQDWAPFGLRRKPPCIDKIELREGASGDGKPIWTAKLVGSQQCKRNFGAFILGKTPRGFMSDRAMPTLAVGKHYFLMVRGIGFAEVPFTY